MSKVQFPCDRCGHREFFYTGDGDIDERCGKGFDGIFMKTDSALCRSFKPMARIPGYALRLHQWARLSGVIGWIIVAIILVILLLF